MSDVYVIRGWGNADIGANIKRRFRSAVMTHHELGTIADLRLHATPRELENFIAWLTYSCRIIGFELPSRVGAPVPIGEPSGFTYLNVPIIVYRPGEAQ